MYNPFVRISSGKHVQGGDALVLSLGDLSPMDSQLFWDTVNVNARTLAIEREKISTRVHHICRGNIFCMVLFQRLLEKDSSLEMAEGKLLDLPNFTCYLSIMNNALMETGAKSTEDNSSFMKMKVFDRILESEGYLLPKKVLLTSPELLHTAEELVKSNLLSVYMVPPLGQNSGLSYPSFTFLSPVVGYFIQTKKNIILEQEIEQRKRTLEHEIEQRKRTFEVELEQEVQRIKFRLFIRD